MTAWADFSVVGPITRTVRDAAMYMDAVAGYDQSGDSSLPDPGIAYRAVLEHLAKLLRFWVHAGVGYGVQSDVLREVEKAANAFKDMGHEITILEESVPRVAEAWLRIGSPQTLANLGRYIEGHRNDFGRAFLANMEGAAKITWLDYGDAWRVRTEFNEWARRIFERFDLLLTPTCAVEAFAAGGPPPPEIHSPPPPTPIAYIPFTFPLNMRGHPAASGRAGMTDSGLPCGMQIIAERHRD